MVWFLLVVSVGVLLLAIPVGVIALWVSVTRLTRRIEVLESRMPPALTLSGPIGAPPAPNAAPPVRVIERIRPAAAPPASPQPRPPTPRNVLPPVTVPLAEPLPATTTAPAVPEEWEVVVGTNWLNKIGVLVFVLGVAFLIAYSFAHVGPAGRIALGYALGGALLGSGVVLQRRPAYRTYAYGLVAGGWAVSYFTTFAMRGVPAARIIDSEVVGVGALVAVAAAMIVHSLVYRSQTVTALAYVVAYGTLGVTPLSGFSAIASLPLTASLLAVSTRLRWPGMMVVGLVSTYLIFAIREQVVPGAAFDPAGPTRYLLLGIYWMLFEAADILARRAGQSRNQADRVPLMALNAIGALGTMLIQIPVDDAALASRVLGGAAAAYLASALVRAALARGPGEGAGADGGEGFTTVHGAVAVSAALFAWTLGLRFSGPRETLVFLLEAQLIVAAGMTLGDAVLRRIGAWLGILVSISAGLLALTHTGATGPLSAIADATPVVALVAGAWFANDTWLRRRGRLAGIERGYTWIALALVGLLITTELTPAQQGPAALVLSALLLERALRDPRDYREQAFVAASLGVLATLQHFTLHPVTPILADVQLWLPLAAALCYGFAWRVLRTGADRSWQVNHLLAGTLMAWAGTTFVATAIWRVVPDAAVGPAWMSLAVLCAVVAARRQAPALRWHGDILAVSAALRTLDGIARAGSSDTTHVAWSLVVIALLFVAAFVPARRTDPGKPGDDRTAFRHGTLMVSATLLLTLLTLDELRTGLVTPIWGLEGLVLLLVGFFRGDRLVRLSGLAVLFACLLKLFGYDLRTLEPLARIVSFVVLGLVLLAVSWGYTKHRETVGRLFKDPAAGPEDSA